MDNVPFNLAFRFEPTIETVAPLQLNFCVRAMEWVEPGQEVGSNWIFTPDNRESRCFGLAPEETSPAVWERWGVRPCTYESLGVDILSSVEGFEYSDGHPDHEYHTGSVKSEAVRWDLGPPDGDLDLDPDSGIDVTALLDIAKNSGRDEYRMVPNGVRTESMSADRPDRPSLSRRQ